MQGSTVNKSDAFKFLSVSVVKGVTVIMTMTMIMTLMVIVELMMTTIEW